MKLIIAGSRKWSHSAALALVRSALEEKFRDVFSRMTELVSGGCRGIDAAAEDYCYKIGKPSKTFIAEWDTYGKAAGPIRNRQMAEYADELLLIWDGKSRGSASMKREMERLGKPVWEFVVGDA